jgi:hypothetical protein
MTSEAAEIVAHLQKQQGGELSQHEVNVLQWDERVLCGQLLLPLTSVAQQHRYTVLDVKQSQQHHYFSYEQWLKFKIIDEKFRLVRLAQTLRLVLPVVATKSSHNDDDDDHAMDVEPPSRSMSLRVSQSLRLSQSTGIPPSPEESSEPYFEHVAPLWLDDLRNDGATTKQQTWGHMVDYMTLFFDFVMMNTELLPARSSDDKVTEYKWSRYLDARAQAYGHNQLAFHFLGTYIRVTRRALPHDPLLQQWLAMQVYLFRHSRCRDGGDNDIRAKLARHVDYFYREHAAVSCHWQHSRWHLLTIQQQQQQPQAQQYWLHQGDEYIIDARWLFEPEFSDLVTNVLSTCNGQLRLDTEAFNDAFLPCLYRHTLQDMIALLVHMSSGREPNLWREHARWYIGHREQTLDTLLYRELTWPEHAFPHCFQGKLAHTEALLDYNVCAHAYPDLSPIVSRMPSHLNEKQRRIAASNARRSNDPGGKVAQLIDIEDLMRSPERLMPPCLSGVMHQKWYKNKDRLNIVAVLLDMGYSDKDAIAGALCRNSSDAAADQLTIEALYDSRMRKKLDGNNNDSYMGRCSIRCGTIINATFESGNNIRCPYEAEESGDTRRQYRDEEKLGFRKKCGDSLEPGYKVVSPMDYISFKAKKLLAARGSSTTNTTSDAT